MEVLPGDCTDSESLKEKWVNWVCVGVTMGTLVCTFIHEQF